MPATCPRPPRADARHDRDRLPDGLCRRAPATPEAPAARARDAFPASREGDR
ncbi:hypothetical protein [Streptosporangium roseum]|uniref:hypothetical protein n=1 Tax=Streptosporangium roseum TaxID=2001 RepID=UPI003326C2F0